MIKKNILRIIRKGLSFSLKKNGLLSCLVLGGSSLFAQKENPVWSKEKARGWYDRQMWIRGCNFIPSTAINQLEMWQPESFDTATINRELGYAASIGFNCVRVFLHHLAWQQDREGFKQRMDTFLRIADHHGIRTMFVFFDDCWNPVYHVGKQPDPKPGIHNSGWLRDPGELFYSEPALEDTLRIYVKDILMRFKKDTRILLWDLYNEPGNSQYANKSMHLLQNVYRWAREVKLQQPVSVGLWNKELVELNTWQLQHSDVITYHNYNAPPAHQEAIDSLRKYGRPLLCTEYMARKHNSLFNNVLPMLKRGRIAAINWGLVSGKTNTIYSWDSPMPDGKEPPLWFHDIFRKDGTPYKQEEIKVIRELTGSSQNFK